jgi:hypothetical protein
MIWSRTWRTFASRVAVFMLAAGGATVGIAATPDTPASRMAVRSGNHPGFGRVVIDTAGQTTYRIDQDGDHVLVRFTGDVMLGAPTAPPRNVIAMTTDGPTVDLTLKHGARLHATRSDGHVILDILDAPDGAASPVDSAAPAPTARRGTVRPVSRPHPPLSMASSAELGGRSAVVPVAPLAAPRAAPVVVPLVAPPAALPATLPAATITTAASTAARVPVAAQPLAPSRPTSVQSEPAESAADPNAIEATQQTPPGRDALPENEGPIDLLAQRVALPKEMDGSAFLVPFNSTTGAAAFRSGDTAYVVFDERRPVDMRAMRADPAFSAASVQLLPGGTLFRVPLPPAQSMALTPTPRGWRIAALTATPKRQPVGVSYTGGQLSLAADQPSNVVTLTDPDTGATLMVGTQRRSGQGVATSRHGAEFILRPTIQGVVVEPLSDAIVLRTAPTGFTLAGGPTGLALSPASSTMDGLMDGALLTRRFAFSTIPGDALLQRAIKQVGDAAESPPRARGPKNQIAAESLMALGLAAEAEGLLHMAAEQDPREAASPDNAALTAISALLAGRPEEADALTDPRLDGTDEISLWRAIRQATLDDGSASAAAVFETLAPLVFQYPEPIRRHILPLIVETMIKNGEIAPAARVLDQRKNDPGLTYARALMQQASGGADQALGMLDAVANGHDQFDRARAAIRAVELRLAAHKLDQNQAADALDKLLYAWRGDARELALRERIAELRGQTGAWQVALAALRQTEADFPEQATAIHERRKDMFGAMIRDQGERQMPAIDFVSIVDENVDVVAGSSDDDAVQQSLADRLLALDLPDRAKPVLEKLMKSAKLDVAKARFGASLAALDAREGDDAGARAVLDASEGSDLPPDLVEKRTILRADSIARLGDPTAAAALLTPLRTAGAIESRAQILEDASDWAGAEHAWSDSVALTLPESGTLDEAQTRKILRLATATARASDDAALADLRAKYGKRVGVNPLADMFKLLTAEPIRTTADIKRSQQEVSLAASLPAGLKALQAGVVTR